MKKRLMLAVALAATLFQTSIFANDGFVSDYVTTPYGEVYKNSYGECWRSRFDDTTDKLEECGYKKIVPVVVEPAAEEININAALLFSFDSAVLSDDAKVILDESISKYKGKTVLTSNVRVIGHTDSTGPQAYNQKLSERRASSVARYLEQNTNIIDDQIDAIGKGESEPEASNETKDGRDLNRRVVIILDGKWGK